MARFSSPEMRFRALVAFLLLVFLTGGSSRDDMWQLLVLRPMAVLFGAYALIHLDRIDLQHIKVPILLLGALFAVTALQLLPLPPAVWTSLPKGALIKSIEVSMGMESGWRPLTLSPSKTWNTLFSLVVPMAALLLLAIQRPYRPQRIWLVIIFIGILSAVFGFIQITGAPNGPAFMYRITNPGVAVGLFANRNHHGVFLAACIMASAWYFSNIRRDSELASARATLSITAIPLFLTIILLSNSRAGLIGGFLAVGAALWFIMRSPLLPRTIELSRGFKVSRRMLVGGAATAIGMIGIATIFSNQSKVFGRLVARDEADELRVQLIPIFQQMFVDFFPFGSGFGSFEYVYKMYEPLEMLQPAYVNLAHNDWAQWLIEGGLLGLLIAAALLVWLFVRAKDVFDGLKGPNWSMRILSLAMIALWGLGSIVDYPLRVPSIMVLFTLCCFCICQSPKRT